ncbi:Hypothetical predicted protein [Prunus dulcis]|uniref:Uncharacterized protein n=1 Tax=Prunus dulcis TaxID=3755 RepID=A0A5E4G3L7_PRUDU|nr:Hypothetical predicted protein [Prunus dulcis]
MSINLVSLLFQQTAWKVATCRENVMDRLLERDVSAFGLKPRQDLPVGLPRLVGPRACPGSFGCAGVGFGLVGGLLPWQGLCAGGALRKGKGAWHAHPHYHLAESEK